MEQNKKKRPAARRTQKPGTTAAKANPGAKTRPGSAGAGKQAAPVRKKRPVHNRSSAQEQQRRKQEAAARRRQESAQKRARNKTKRRMTQKPDVIYTPPKPFNRNRLLLRLATAAAVVAALMLCMSIFFKVEHIVVYGAEAYDPWTVREAAGIQEGDNLLSFGSIRASSKIIEELPYVDKVRIGIKLPDTVNIVIDEAEVAYAIADQDNAWWLITASGRVIESTDSGTAGGYTKILGIRLQSPVEGEDAVAVEAAVEATESQDATAAGDGAESTIAPQVTTTGADRLAMALTIVELLERNDLIGLIASVNVADLGNMQIWYGEKYQVELGDETNLEYKITAMRQSIAQLDDFQTGVLDVSFRTLADQPIYKHFD